MPAPVLDGAAAYLYSQLAPLDYDDAQNNYALQWWCKANAAPYEQLWSIQGGEDVAEPWAVVMDLDTCPDYALDWLAQFAGVPIPSGLDAASKRLRIAETEGQQRGGITALTNGIKTYLTGTKRVTLRERDGGAYWLTIITYTSETPADLVASPGANVEIAPLIFCGSTSYSVTILRAVQEQKPAGVRVTLRVDPGWSVGELEAAVATVGSLESSYTTINNVESKILG